MMRSTDYLVMAGHSRPKDGVASARLRPAILRAKREFDLSMDARVKPAHDELSERRT
ncbi:hypothetical protein ABIB82_004466 [Bradyrhizobium sp. i1.8.4]